MTSFATYDSQHLHLYQDGTPLGPVAQFTPGDQKLGNAYVYHKLVLKQIVHLAIPPQRLELFEEVPGSERRFICAMQVANDKIASPLFGAASGTTIMAHETD